MAEAALHEPERVAGGGSDIRNYYISGEGL